MRATKINRASFTKPGHALMFVVDEVGQFVARDTQKMLDLQAIVQQLGVKGRGKYWIAVTSQERLSEVVSGLDDRRIELPKLMDRFPLQVHLEPSDISEVTSRRVLAKKAPAETLLGKLYDDNRARLDLNSRITADIKLPALTRENFVDLYPLLPYQIELIIDIVSGLRMQGGASKHVGGANRTIIKLAQQLLINPATKVSEAPIGTLARLDQVYDLIEGNIGSDLRAKIISIPTRVQHPLAQAVAKVVCLLQFQDRPPDAGEYRRRARRPRRCRLQADRGPRGARRSRKVAHGPPGRRWIPHSHARRGRLGADAVGHRTETGGREAPLRLRAFGILGAAAEFHARRREGLQGRPDGRRE